jgi:molecular chaperone GrpE
MNEEQKMAEGSVETEQSGAEETAGPDLNETVDQQEVAEDPRTKEELLLDVTRLQGELQELQGKFLRASADFDNFRRRTRQEKEELGQYATMQFVQSILPVLDNFQLALAAGNTDAESLKKGVEMVFRQFQNTFESAGITEMNAVGQPFDPNFHEAVMQVESDEHESGTVVEELRKGYLFNDKVIRPAMVQVAK